MIENYIFEKLKASDLDTQLKLRNQINVRQASFNKKIIAKSEHLKWYKEASISNDFDYYALKHNDLMIGVGYGNDYSKKNKSLLWGFYIDSQIDSEIKYGSIIKYLLFEKLFKNKQVETIRCQVLFEFTWIKEWHERWGHTVDKTNYNEKYYNLSLKKETWKSIRDKIYNSKL